MSGSFSPVEEVRRAKARYCRFIDTKRWDDFSSLFIDAPEIRVFDPNGELASRFDVRDDFVSAARTLLHDAQSSHQVHNDEIDLVSSTEIRAIWSMEDTILVPAASAGQLSRLHGYGHYHERWNLTSDGWRIAQLDLRRTILTVVER